MATLTLRSLLGLEVGIILKALLGQRTTRLLGKPVGIINPQARIEESEVSPHVNCLSICYLGKYPLTLHQKARLYGTTALSNPPPVKNIRSHETNQQPGHRGVRIEEQEGNLTKMKRHADSNLPITHDIPRPGKLLKLKKVAISKGGKYEASIARSPRGGVGHGRGRRS
ncbi:hypothetical protein GBA52_024732 [Prunus armeniaca]|nr:hypothetical protein GBA52_024732 [Prunus armeniaca]